MVEKPLNQSLPRRAWVETKESFHKIWFFWSAQVAAVGAFALLGTIFTPENAGRLASAIYPIASGAVGAVVGFGIIYLICLIKAPCRQRDEARALLQAKPKPIPLQNRKELRGAIASVENTTIQLVNKVNELKNADSQNPYLAELATVADEAYDRWNESMNELRRQYLIAGDAYESVCVELTGFIWMQVAAIMEKLKYPEDIKPIVLKDVLQFVGALGGRVKEALRKIDEISGQAPDKKDPQTE